jgi:hypothetical protein
VIAPAGVALHPAGLGAHHRYDSVAENHLTFCAISLNIRTNRDFGHGYVSPHTLTL